MNTEEQIARFIASELLEDTSVNGDPLARGMLDSLSIEVLIGWIEEQFEISFGFRDVVAENFASVGALAAFVDAKRIGPQDQSTDI
ncbi:MAG: phosphopantetheine-binding protein [Acidimicrobiales bacterium]|jgi:acyl carrier protein